MPRHGRRRRGRRGAAVLPRRRFGLGAVVEHDGQGIVPGGVLRPRCGWRRRIRSPGTRSTCRADAARLQHHGPRHPLFPENAPAPGRPSSRQGLAVRRTRARGHGAATARQAGEAEARRVLAPDQLVRPAVLAEAQQHGRVGDARPVVGDCYGECESPVSRRVAPTADGYADPRGVSPATVLQSFQKGVGEPAAIGAGDPADGALVEARPDGRRARQGGGFMREPP